MTFESFFTGDHWWKFLPLMNIWPKPCSLKDWNDPLQTVTCFTGYSKESIFFYSTNAFNLSWETKVSGCGLIRIPCHNSLQRVHKEMGCSTLYKFYTAKVAPFEEQSSGPWYPLYYPIFHRRFRTLFKLDQETWLCRTQLDNFFVSLFLCSVVPLFLCFFVPFFLCSYVFPFQSIGPLGRCFL